jgi:branched-chain amino acid transport system permease protein
VLGVGVEYVLRAVQGRDESLQLLVTFALVLIFQDGLRFVWGAQPRLVDDVMAQHGQIAIAGVLVPAYHLVVVACSAGLALGLWWLVERTGFGQILKACAENSAMAAGLGIDTSRVSLATVTLGSMLSAIGGALVIPTTAATLDMSQTLIVEAFAVIVIGGLGSIKGALVGAAAVGMVRTLALVIAPEVEIIAVYGMVIAVLLIRPQGLFGRAEA